MGSFHEFCTRANWPMNRRRFPLNRPRFAGPPSPPKPGARAPAEGGAWEATCSFSDLLTKHELSGLLHLTRFRSRNAGTEPALSSAGRRRGCTRRAVRWTGCRISASRAFWSILRFTGSFHEFRSGVHGISLWPCLSVSPGASSCPASFRRRRRKGQGRQSRRGFPGRVGALAWPRTSASAVRGDPRR